ncbi:MAG TPA: hypothetical protein VJS13_00920 [Pyrinomonadaceae bacterium]|nr:hypothetical protein [Pyrinomonadaceae bacterium]
MQTQPSTSFSPFRPGLKLESTNPTVDPPEGGGGTGGGTTPAPQPAPEEEEEP